MFALPAAHTAWLLYERARAISGAASHLSSWLTLLLTDVDSEVRLLLEQLVDRVESVSAPLSFALQWSQSKGSAIAATAFRARSVLQRVDAFIAECSEKRGQVALIDRDWLVRQLRFHLSELDFALTSLSLAMQLVQAASPMKPLTANISSSALVRASERLNSMRDSGGDVAVSFGALYKREARFSPVIAAVNGSESITSFLHGASLFTNENHFSLIGGHVGEGPMSPLKFQRSLSDSANDAPYLSKHEDDETVPNHSQLDWSPVWPAASLKIVRRGQRYEIRAFNTGIGSESDALTFDLDDSIEFRLAQRFEIEGFNVSGDGGGISSAITGDSDDFTLCFQWNFRLANTLQTSYAFIVNDHQGQPDAMRPIDFEYVAKLAAFENQARTSHTLATDEQLWQIFNGNRSQSPTATQLLDTAANNQCSPLSSSQPSPSPPLVSPAFSPLPDTTFVDPLPTGFVALAIPSQPRTISSHPRPRLAASFGDLGIHNETSP